MCAVSMILNADLRPSSMLLLTSPPSCALPVTAHRAVGKAARERLELAPFSKKAAVPCTVSGPSLTSSSFGGVHLVQPSPVRRGPLTVHGIAVCFEKDAKARTWVAPSWMLASSSGPGQAHCRDTIRIRPSVF